MTGTDRAPLKRQRNRRALTAQITIVSIGLGVLLLTGAYAGVATPRPLPTGNAAEVPDEYAPWRSDDAYAEPMSDTWTAMNKALLEKDRDAFLASATGDAVTQLGAWWDNTTAIGWDVAAISPVGLSPLDDDNTVQVTLGAQFAFAAQSARGTGNADSALQLIQGFQYTLSLEPSEDPYASDRKIISMTPSNEPNPWDEGSLYVVKRDHVVLFGMSDESALVDATADVAEESAVIALDEIRGMGGDLPQDGFVSAITGDDTRFARWEFGTGTPWAMDVAGYARPTYRPSFTESWLDPVIATGSDTSGTLVVLGPKSADQRKETFVHEFAHALHLTAAPGSFLDPPASVMEGFARYVEWDTGVSEPKYRDARVKEAVATLGADAFSDEALRSADANVAYEAAGSYYAFVAANGGSAWDTAVKGQTAFGGLVGIAERSDTFSIPQWQAWVAQQ